MNFIDTHSHLYLEDFDADRAEVIQRAQDVGIYKILLPNIDSTSWEPMLQLSQQYPDYFYPMAGLHPTSVKENFRDELQQVEEALKTKKFIAIGEIGIDLYWDKTYAKEQEIALRQQLDWSIAYDLPVVIHMRESFEAIYAVLKDYQQLRGVFHCFTGTYQQAQAIIEKGFYLGIGGVATFKNSGLDQVLAQLSLEHLMLETDAPFLAPTPLRGKRNESSFMIKVAEKLASIYQKPLTEIAETTTQNAKHLFHL